MKREELRELDFETLIKLQEIMLDEPFFSLYQMIREEVSTRKEAYEIKEIMEIKKVQKGVQVSFQLRNEDKHNVILKKEKQGWNYSGIKMDEKNQEEVEKWDEVIQEIVKHPLARIRIELKG